MATIEKVRPKDIRGFFEVGETYVCEENTYADKHEGTVITLEKVGKSVAEGRIRSFGKRGGVFALSLPVTIRDSLEVTDDSVTYLLGNTGRAAGCSVTWRRLYPGECPECGDIHGEPDEYGNRFIEELGICNNCAEVEA